MGKYKSKDKFKQNHNESIDSLRVIELKKLQNQSEVQPNKVNNKSFSPLQLKDTQREHDYHMIPNISQAIEKTIAEFNELIKKRKITDKMINSKEIGVQFSSSTIDKRNYDKLFSCYYCGKFVLKMSAHLLTVHQEEVEVRKIEQLDVGSEERKKRLEKMRLKGNFVHMSVLNKGAGTLLVVRSSKRDKFKVTKYLPCIFCYGFFLKWQAFKHMKLCCHQDPNQKCKECLTKQSKRLLLAITKSSSHQLNMFLSLMRNDAVTNYIKQDPSLLLFGEKLIIKKGRDQRKLITDKLRHLCRFFFKYNLEYDCLLSTNEIINSMNFDKIQQLAKNMSKDETDEQSSKKSMSFVLRLGQILKEITTVLKISIRKSMEFRSKLSSTKSSSKE